MQRIKEPGKFENEHVSTPFFWDLALNDDGDIWDDNGTLMTRIRIESSDRETFPDIPEQAVYIVIYELDNGFVRMDFENSEMALLCI